MTERTTPMTQEEYRAYVAEKGHVCPSCGSHDVSGGFVYVENGEAFQDLNCHDCDFEWTDVYKLTHYEVPK